jgi:hypothetical protein
MPDFHFKRLEKYRVGGTEDQMELNIPLPKSPSGKVYRLCPNSDCTPRLFLIGNGQKPENIDVTLLRRAPGTPETTCPYCGMDAADAEYNHPEDIDALLKKVGWAAMRDAGDYLDEIVKDFNRSVSRAGPISMKITMNSHNSPEPEFWREDLIRNLACDMCGREYGVYAIALFCPDCGCKNLHVHFEREIELILQQIDLAEQVAENGNHELSYRILGNAHEDVVTAFETYQKTSYKFMVKKAFPKEKVEKMTSKRAIGNQFQNIDKAKNLYKNLSFDPFSVLTTDELELMKVNIEKRHVIGHNLSMADEAYSERKQNEKPGTTVQILADEISEFAKTAKKVVLELERQM